MTSMATAGSRWGVVMSRNAGFSDQVEFCFSSAFTVLSLSFRILLVLIVPTVERLCYFGGWGGGE